MSETDDSTPTRPYSPILGVELPLLDHAAPLHGPVRLGRYVLLDVVGAGGMGVVYTAYDPQLDRKIALKVLRPAVAGAAAQGWQARLLREARAMARLSHPNVVHVHDAGEADGEVYVAMQLVEGEDLRRRLRGGQRPWREVLNVLLQAGRGLFAAHQAGLVHRDFKPENVLIGRDGRVCVTDFGLAALAETRRADAEELTPSPRPGGSLPSIVGTPEYVAPEQLWGAASDPLADQFSFCVTAHEALYGQRPFAGANAAQLAHAAAKGEVRPPPADTEVPAWVRAAVLRGLEADPAQRHPSMEALLAALTPPTPLAQRRWLRVTASLAAAAFAFVTLWNWNEARLLRACSAGGDRFAGVWDAATRAQMRSAFEATGLPGAQERFQRAAAGLDLYVGGWERARTEVCVATRVRGEQTAPVMAERLRCLEARAHELHAVTRLFATADEATVRRSGQAISGLESTGACASLVPRGAASGGALRAEDVGARTRLAEGWALQRLGKYGEALVAARAIQERARAEGNAGLAAEALLLDCETQLLLDPPDRPVDGPCLEAALTAEEAGDPVRAAYAWTQLVDGSTNNGAYAEAQRWLKIAQSMTRRLGPGHPEAAARLATSEGFAAFGQGDYAAAAEAWERALAIRDRELPESAWDRSALTANLGAALMKGGHPDRAIGLLERSLRMHQEILGDEHPEVSGLLTFLAMAHHGVSDLERARELFLQSIAMRRRLEGPEANVSLELGNLAAIELDRGAFAEALKTVEESYRLREAALGRDHPFVAVSLLNRATALRGLGRHAEAAPLVERAVALREAKYGPRHPQTAGAWVELAVVRRTQGRDAEALALIRRALATTVRALGPDHPESLLAKIALAETLLKTGHADDALAAAREATTQLAGRSVRVGLKARQERVLALSLHATGQVEEASRAAARADAHYRTFALPGFQPWRDVQALLSPVRAAR